MSRQMWQNLGMACGVGVLLVTWLTAYNPILGSRELNWVAIIGLGALGYYAIERGKPPR
jgi:D-arabinose 1-dehydrogenase-like Zn-dependent alcohol dehydrogenase